MQPRGLAGAGLEPVRGEPVLKALLFSTEPLEPVSKTGSKGTLEPVLMTCFALVGGDSRTVDFDGKVENPWLEAKTKHVPELLVLKSETKFF